MDKAEFIDKLSKTYKEGNEIIYQDLIDWINRKNLGPFHLMSLYDKIKLKYKYKTFPSLSFINDCLLFDFPELTDEKDEQEKENKKFRKTPLFKFRENSKKLTTEELFKKLSEINDKRSNGLMNVLEMDLWDTYGPLYAEYSIMVDLEYGKKEIKEHLEYVHKKISTGEDFNSKFIEAKRRARAADIERKGQQHISEVL